MQEGVAKNESIEDKGKCKQTLQIQGIAQWELRQILEQLGGIEDKDGNYQSDCWQAVLSDEQKVTIGSLTLQTTTITFSGSRPELEKLLLAFRKKTLRGGG
ncbi:hypothetical protein F9B85_06845 [Heliorestis acidaminivorans]|uniref:Molybdopterin cofactor biosynthesis MoaD-related C-terminal domain-containing protein n=1 Tax=Heliorestis acidaminivorans TaxID=553427 RepID=A0A6I0F317_9FIRM|nr:hypothetical protein [Heliorestis acidaminivorans]KAB2952976.1 hypothetical protein F9B85_06845 [Heliorestis acidaminivorans]